MTPYEQLLQKLATPIESTSVEPGSTFPQIPTSPYNIQDGDTVNNQRLTGFDTAESYIDSDKAIKIAKDFGISLADQKAMGLAGKEQLDQLLSTGQYDLEREGYGYYGRPLVGNEQLTADMITSGVAVPTTRYDAKMQTLYRNAALKKQALHGTYGDEISTLRDIQLDRETPSLKSRINETIDAFQSGGIQALGSFGDWIADMGADITESGGNRDLAESMRHTFFEKWKDTAVADKMTGYDRRETDFKTQEALFKWNQGKYASALGTAMTAAPEVLAESLPLMIEMMIGQGKLKAGNAALNAIKGNAGFLAVVGQESNSDIEEFTANNNGVEPTLNKTLEIVGTNFAMFALDKMVFKDIVNAKTVLKETIATLPKDTASKIAMKAASMAFKVAESGTKEAGQEYLQTWGEILNVQKDANGKTFSDVINDEANQEMTKAAALMGFGAGGTLNVAGQVGAPIKNAVDTQRAENLAPKVEANAAANFNQAQMDIMDQYKAENPNIKGVDDLTDFQKSAIDALATEDPETDIPTMDTVDEPTRTQELNTNIADLETKLTVDMPLEERTKIEEEINTLEKELAAEETTKDNEVIQTYIKELKDKGVPQEDIDALVNSLDQPGISDIVTQAMKESNLNLEVLTPVRKAAKGGKKPQSFNVAKTTDDHLIEVANGEFDIGTAVDIAGETTNTKITETFVKRFKRGSAVQEKVSEVFNNVRESLSKGKGTKELESIFKGQAKEGNGLRLAAILGDVVNDAISSEYNLHANNDADNSNVDFTRKSNVTTELGKRMVNSYGIKFAGDSVDINKEYTKLGEKILAYGSAIGMIQISEDPEFLPAVATVDSKGNRLIGTKAFLRENYQAKEGIGVSGKAITLVAEPTIKLTDSLGKGETYFSDTGDAMKGLSGLLKPNNEFVPDDIPSTEVEVSQDSPISEKHKAIIRKYNTLKYIIKATGIDLVADLKARSENYASLDEFFAKDEVVKAFLGTRNRRSFLVKLKDQGRNINRKNNLRNLINNFEDLPDQFNYTFESAVNNRIHVMENILEFQGDKYMARQLISSGLYTTSSKEEVNLLVNSLASELKVNPKAITDSGVDPKIDKALNFMLNTTAQITAEDYVILANIMGIDNPFKAMSLLDAVRDIRQADSDTKVTTDYMPEFDMTASGVINTLMNLSGNPKVQAILNKLINEGADPYTIVDSALNTKSLAYIEHIEPMINSLQAIGINRRDVAKYLVMKWFYGSKNTAQDMAHDISVDIVLSNSPEARNIVKKAIGVHLGKDMANTITKDQFAKLVDYMQVNFANHYKNALDTAYPGVEAYREKMGTIFEILQNQTKWDGKIGSAMAAKEGTNHKMSVMKEKGTTYRDEKGFNIPINKKFLNVASFFVNLQHSTDAAQLLTTLDQVMEENGLGIMTVHDAFYADPKTLRKLKPIYENSLKEFALDYDYLDTAIKEVEYQLSKMDQDSRSVKDAQAIISTLKAENDQAMEAKADYLENIETNFFGDKSVTASMKEQAEPVDVDTETEAGYITVVFNAAPHNQSGRAWDYKVKDVTKYKAGDIVKVLGTTIMVKKVMNSKDYVQKEGIRYKDISRITLPTKQDVKQQLNKVQEVLEAVKSNKMENVIDAISNLDISDNMIELRDKIIAGMMEGVYTVDSTEFKGGYGKIKVDTNNTMNPINSKKKLTNDALIEILAHEMDHAIHFDYISRNMKSPELAYLVKAVDNLREKITDIQYSTKTLGRIKYILDNSYDETMLANAMAKRGVTREEAIRIYQVSEFVSIMRNEQDVYNEIISKDVGHLSLPNSIARLIKKVAEWVKSLTKDQIKKIFNSDPDVTYNNTLAALEVVDMNAKLYNEDPKKYNTEELDLSGIKQNDIYKDAYINPMKYAEGIIAKQNTFLSQVMDVFGGYAITLASPIILKGHKKLIGSSDIYARTTNVIRHGFVHSEFAQKMRGFLGTEKNIDEKAINEMLHLADDVQQSMVEMLHVNLPELDSRVKNMYSDPKDRKTVYQIFAKTGIAGLAHNPKIAKGIINGSMTIADALVIAKADIHSRYHADIEALANYYVTGKMVDGKTNLASIGVISKRAETLVALEALAKVPNSQAILSGMDKKLKQELYGMTLNIKALHEEINNKPGRHNTDYDGHFTMDVNEDFYEQRLVTAADIKYNKYNSEADWFVLREPTKDTLGIVARKLLDKSNTPGVGLNANRFDNSMFLSPEDTVLIKDRLASLGTEADRRTFLNKNGIIRSAQGTFRLFIDEDTKASKLEMQQSVAHSLWRTYVKNVELIAMQSVRDIALNQATITIGSSVELDKLNDTIAKIKGKDVESKEVLPLFLKLDYEYKSYSSLPSWVKKYYKIPRNLTTFDNFNEQITLVKKGQSDILLGHANFSPFSGETKESRMLTKALAGFKNVVIMAKQKMAVANAGKLFTDIVSNLGILGAKDVSIQEMYSGIKEGYDLYKDFSTLRSEKVQLTIKARAGMPGAQTALDKIEKKIKAHKFYQSFKNGFIQSYSTSLVVKEFDTISGLQKNIDDIVESITKDKKGNPNEIFKAIKWWQEFGASHNLTVDSLLDGASKQSKINGTTIGDEMTNMATRLRRIRNDKDSVARYVNNIIGGPASEAVTIGGAVMVTADVLSKYTLARSLVKRTNPVTKKLYTEEEAYIEANNTFIDYRKNMPSEIKALSDYGILMFPSFWIKAQKVIAGLIHYHPATAVGGYVVADMLDVSSANFLDVNIINKALDGRIINDPTSLVDWDVLTPFL